MNPWTYFEALQYRLCSLLSLVALLLLYFQITKTYIYHPYTTVHWLPCCFLLFALQKLISTIRTTLLSPSLRRTSAHIQFAIVLGVFGTQEISCI